VRAWCIGSLPVKMNFLFPTFHKIQKDVCLPNTVKKSLSAFEANKIMQQTIVNVLKIVFTLDSK